MSDDLNVITLAQQLLDSLYDTGDLSVDQHAGVAAGLAQAVRIARDRNMWRKGHEGMTRALREVAESAGVVFESSRDQDDIEHWAWRFGAEHHPAFVAEGGAAFSAIRWIAAEFRQGNGQRRQKAEAALRAACSVIDAWGEIAQATPLDLDLSALAMALGEWKHPRGE